MDRQKFLAVLDRSSTAISEDETDEVFFGEVRNLLTENNTKTLKGLKKGYMSAILHLAPSDRSGFQVCPKATAGCRAACLNTAGHGGVGLTTSGDNVVQIARRRKTYWYFVRRPEFIERLELEISKHIRKARRKELIPCVRLNGTSDIRWERVPFMSSTNVFEHFPDIQFYDYTKVPGRDLTIPNYHLTFSLAESNDTDAQAELERGCNIAVVFDKVPETYLGTPVIDGDESDLRFLDPAGVVVGLKAKGEARHDSSGFVRKEGS